MALTRKMLKALGLSEEHIETIIEAHGDTVTALTRERDTYKAQAESLESVTKERDTYKEQAEKAGDAAKVKAEFDAYKSGVEKKELNARKSSALSAAFEAAGVQRESFRKLMLRGWDMDSVELDENGAIKDADGIAAAVKKDYADFIATGEDKPLPPNNPPGNNHQTYTREDIRKMSPEEINKNWANIQKSLSSLK